MAAIGTNTPVLTQDAYSEAATIQSIGVGNGGGFNVGQNYVILQTQSGGPGNYVWNDEIPYSPVIGAQIPAGITGIRFRSAVAGVPAQVQAWIAEGTNTYPTGGTPQAVTNTMITGQVDASGNITGGKGFTVVRTGTGIYQVSFNTQFTNVPVVVSIITTIALSSVVITLNAITVAGFTAETFNTSFANVNAAWNFVALPVS